MKNYYELINLRELFEDSAKYLIQNCSDCVLCYRWSVLSSVYWWNYNIINGYLGFNIQSINILSEYLNELYIEFDNNSFDRDKMIFNVNLSLKRYDKCFRILEDWNFLCTAYKTKNPTAIQQLAPQHIDLLSEDIFFNILNGQFVYDNKLKGFYNAL
jgi:hypothetical protein